MNDSFSAIPWRTSALWLEANNSLKHILQNTGPALEESRRLAHRLKQQLISTFPLMDRLCRETCFDCADICCRRAWVWADFRDLLFFHLAGIQPPDQQLLSRQGEHCRYGGPMGCRLDRIQRPYVCTWYLCPAQTRRLREEPAQMNAISDSLRRIKGLRQEMETSFIQATT